MLANRLLLFEVNVSGFDLNFSGFVRLRCQGALMQLQDLLDWISNCGVSTIGGWCVGAKGSLKLGSANMRAVRASIMFIKIGNLIYDIFGLACMDYPKNAEVFQRHMSLFDLHLGEHVCVVLSVGARLYKCRNHKSSTDKSVCVCV